MRTQTAFNGQNLIPLRARYIGRYVGKATAALAMAFGLQLSLCAQEADETELKKAEAVSEVKTSKEEGSGKVASQPYNPAGQTIVMNTFPGGDILVGKKIVLADKGVIEGDFFGLFENNGTLVKLSKWRIEKKQVVADFQLKVEEDLKDFRMEIPVKGMQAGATKARFVMANGDKPEVEIAEVSVRPTEESDTEESQTQEVAETYREPTREEIYRIQQYQALQRQRQLEMQRARAQRQYEDLRRQAEYEAAEEANRALRDFNYNRFP